MEDFFKKCLFSNYKYSIIIAVSYYLLPPISLIVPVKDAWDRPFIFLIISFILIPLIIFITSMVFASYHILQWYFSLRIFILGLPYILFGTPLLIVGAVFFVISIIGQYIGTLIYENSHTKN